MYKKLGSLFLLSVIFHTLTRLTFYLWNLKEYHHTTLFDLVSAFAWGLRFDLAATATLLVPGYLLLWVLGPRLPKWVLFAATVPLIVVAVALNFIDIEMINFVGRRFTYSTLFIFREVQGKVGGYFSTYAAMIIFVLLLLGILTWFGARLCLKPVTSRSFVKHWAAGFAGAVVMVILIRGGLQNKPISFAGAQLFSSSWLNNLVMNTTFSVIKSADQKGLIDYGFFTDPQERLTLLNGGKMATSLLEGRRPQTKSNVIILVLESFNLEYMGAVNGDQGYTPFLDSLAKKSLFFTRAIANGRRSIEGVPAVLTGVPTLMDEPFITSGFSSVDYLKLPQILKDRGYHTSFFHGGNNGTMYFDAFARGLGIDHYFGANEHPNPADHDGTWGIFDEPFLQFYAGQLRLFPQPFFSVFFSLTSHQPYKIPDRYKERFPEGPIPILKAVAYADYSLQKFFESVQHESWFQNTLFVITADHTHMSFRENYQDEVSKYRVPLLFYHPQMVWPKVPTEQIVQQIDIPSSILDFLGIQPDFINPLGQSVFKPGDKAAVVYSDGKYLLIEAGASLEWFAGTPLEVDSATVQKNVQKMKAQIDYHNRGLLQNQLLIKRP